MNLLLTILIFVLVLLLYTHVLEEFKKGGDLEIYETDFTDGARLGEVCKLKQPVLFEFQSTVPCVFEKLRSKAAISRETNESLHVFERKGAGAAAGDDDDGDDDGMTIPFPLPFESAAYLLSTDEKRRYITERNESFMAESGYAKFLNRELGAHLRPALGTVSASHDLLFGSAHTSTPCRYHTSSRYFLCVSSGKVVVRMSPWKSAKHLRLRDDYVNFDFRASPAGGAGGAGGGECFRGNRDLKYLEFEVPPGCALSIPPFWFYAIEFCSNDSLCFASRYATLFNRIAHLDRTAAYLWEQETTVFKVHKSVSPEAGRERGVVVVGTRTENLGNVRVGGGEGAGSSVEKTIASVQEIQDSLLVNKTCSSGGGGGGGGSTGEARGGGGGEEEQAGGGGRDQTDFVTLI